MEMDFLAKLIIRAATDTFGMMLDLQINAGEPHIEHRSPTESERVVALIGIAGSWIGTGMLSSTPEFACKISSILLMNEYEAVTEDVLDAMAEMANMIFGNVKTELEERLGPLGLSIPTVIFGRNFSTRSVGQQSWTVVPIRCGKEVMELKLCLAKNHDYQANSRLHSRPYSLLREEV